MWYMMGSSTVFLVGCAMFFILMFQPQMQISVEEEANYVYVAHPAAALMRTLEEEANYVIAPPAPLMIFHDKGCELMDSEMPEEPTDGDAYEDSYYVDRNVVDDDDGGQDDGGHDDDDDDEENPNYDYAGDDSSDDDDDDDDDDDSSDDDDDDDDSGSSSDDEEDDDEAAREEWEAFRNQYL